MQLQTTLFIILFDLVAISDSVYTALLPYFSPVAKDKGFTETEIGIMLAFYPIGSVIATPFVSMCSSKRKAILIGLIQSSIATIGMGVSKFSEGGLFFALSCIFRVIIGSGASFLLIPSYAALPILFKEDVTQKIAGLEMGHCVGRITSTGLFTMIAQLISFDTYQLPCYGLALIYVVSFLVTYKYFYLPEVPEGISPKKKQKEAPKPQINQNHPITITKSQTITPIEVIVQNDNSLIQQNEDLNQSQQQLKPNELLNQSVQNAEVIEGQLQRHDTTMQTLEVPQVNGMRKSSSSGGEDRSCEEDTLHDKKAINKWQTQIRSIIQQRREGKPISIPDSPKMNNSQKMNHVSLFESGNKMQNSTQLEVLQEQEEITEDDGKLEVKDYVDIFKNKSLQVTFIFFFWLSALENGLRPFLANELGDYYGLSEYNISYLFMIPIFTYLLSAILVARQTYFQEQTLFKFGMWILAVSFFFYCPTVFKLPHSIAFILVGEFMRGISLGIGCALFIPNISDSCVDKVGVCKANLIGANLYQFGWSLGDIFGPIICGAFVEKIGYELTTLFSGFVIIVFTIIYLIFRKNKSRIQVITVENINNKVPQNNNA
ncbi:unnamed protein product (macronuclear) [Paramecium tetraurelia]|uniref:Major facilitator superfamily (MFS) profile domain-containing protein n=1 Tax=Paramecium tetraurelia TaxID=5888 RepID=A0DLA8_PARTE|nr:uncharacterized protein GSPATT00018142001 [Paramecium tetraurelia]CAK83825.1 unnamed protein product [Paramecium tetraurelia]|eukprot:XP_001451222.1 hypothetical protein (macronuclear) [Paramecium tetraurelia strain d4-2]